MTSEGSDIGVFLLLSYAIHAMVHIWIFANLRNIPLQIHSPLNSRGGLDPGLNNLQSV